eukprot:136497_1
MQQQREHREQLEELEQKIHDERQLAQDREEKMSNDFRLLLDAQNNQWTQRLAQITDSINTVRNTATTNRNAATNNEYIQATNEDYFADITTNLAYRLGTMVDNN